MYFESFQPHPGLKPFVACIWVSEHDFDEWHGAIDILPDSYVDLVFSSGHKSYFNDGHRSGTLPGTYVARITDKPIRLYGEGILCSIGVRFYAWGFSLLDSVTLPPAGAIIYPLDDLWPGAQYQIQQMLAYRDMRTAIDTVESQLLDVVRGKQQIPDKWLYPPQLLYKMQGNMTVAELADSCYLSRRQLERRFRSLVGTTPKSMARTIRFQHIRDAMALTPIQDLTCLAHQYGFSDQAHFSREFKTFANRTPTQYISEIQSVIQELRFGLTYPTS